MVKQKIRNVGLGILASLVIMAIGFYFFLFANPLNIHQPNLLKWLPVLIGFVAIFVGGKINKNTPIGLLPLLFVSFVVFDLFHYFYFPFILVLVAIGILALVITRQEANSIIKVGAGIAAAGIFLFYLLSQPLIIEQKGFGRNVAGDPVNATVLWQPSAQKNQRLHTQTLVDANNNKFHLNQLQGQTHFIAVWATWCGPCIKGKPQLDSLKQGHRGQVTFVDVSLDEKRSQWQDFLEQHNPKGIQLISTQPNATRRDLEIGSIPRYFVVNEHGHYKTFTTLQQAGQALANTVGSQ